MPARHGANGAAEEPPARRYASIAAAAKYYDVDYKTARRWISRGLVHGYRIGRNVKLDLNEVDANVVKEIPDAQAGRT